MTFTPEEILSSAFSAKGQIIVACAAVRKILYDFPGLEQIDHVEAQEALKFFESVPIQKVMDTWAFLNNEERVAFCLLYGKGKFRAFHDIQDAEEFVAQDIAEYVGTTQQGLEGACQTNPELKAAHERGVAKKASHLDRKLSWYPRPDQIEMVQSLSAKGYRDAEIVAKLNQALEREAKANGEPKPDPITRHSFTLRLKDCEALAEAYEQGDGEYRVGIMDEANDMLKFKQDSSRNVMQLMIFKLKSRCKLSDRPDKENAPPEEKGNTTINAVINMPATQPVGTFQNFAQLEMERANKLRIERQAAKALQVMEVIDLGSAQ
ncbi:unnamed protein product [Sphagnum compactum]